MLGVELVSGHVVFVLGNERLRQVGVLTVARELRQGEIRVWEIGHGGI